MLSYIRGTVTEIGTDEVVVETGGVGFCIFTSEKTSGQLIKDRTAVLYTHMSVREDDLSLFGFLTKEERTVFRMLISVSGVGPKSALSLLSCLTVDELRMAVLSDDSKAIAKANGIGAKTAQRVIMELRDKFHLEDVLSEADSPSGVGTASDDIVSEAALALSSLGYSNTEALRAVRKVSGSEHMTVEELLKAALKTMI